MGRNQQRDTKRLSADRSDERRVLEGLVARLNHQGKRGTIYHQQLDRLISGEGPAPTGFESSGPVETEAAESGTEE